jgi:rhodanese-related sulfurtransferase
MMTRRFCTLAAMVGTTALIAGMAFAQSSTKPAGSDGKPAGSTSKAEAKPVTAQLNAAALGVLLDARMPIALVDARGKSDSWIAGAIPLAHDASPAAIGSALKDKAQIIITYCGGPACPASQMLADSLSSMGYGHVIVFHGGVEEWTAAGMPLAMAEGSGAKPAGSESKPAGSGSR